MFQVRKHNAIRYEDLMLELGLIEQSVIREDSDLAMRLMVLEAKLRERFQDMETLIHRKGLIDDDFKFDDELTLDEIQALIPQDLPKFPEFEEEVVKEKRNKTIQTMGMAALLAVITALGVFGIASFLQLIVSWIS